MAAVTVDDLTTGTVDGTGVFDDLMKSTLAHIEQEYSKNRIRGPEYATVYLGALQSVLDRSIQFLLAQQSTDLQAQLLTQQVANAGKEGAILDQQLLQLQEQTALVTEQKNLTIQETAKALAETNVLNETKLKVTAETSLVTNTESKISSEIGLLDQKKVTEEAQVSATGVDVDSIIGRQKQLYERQSDGFLRDAEQKAAKTMIDTWNVRRTTDSGEQPTADNKLQDSFVGQAVQKLLDGIGA